MSYTNPLVVSLAANASASLSTAATAASYKVPADHVARVVDLSAVITTAVTAAAAAAQVGLSGTLAKYATLEVPIATAGNGYSAAAAGLLTDDDNLIPEGTVVLLNGDGAATAGAADLNATLHVFKT